MSPTAVARVTRTPSLRALVAFVEHLGPTPTFDDAGRAAAAQTIAGQLDAAFAAVMGNPESFTGFLVTQQAAAGPLYMSRPLIANPRHRAVADIFPTSTLKQGEQVARSEAPLVRLLSPSMRDALQEASAVLLAEKRRAERQQTRCAPSEEHIRALDSCLAHVLSVMSMRAQTY